MRHPSAESLQVSCLFLSYNRIFAVNFRRGEKVQRKCVNSIVVAKVYAKVFVCHGFLALRAFPSTMCARGSNVGTESCPNQFNIFNI